MSLKTSLRTNTCSDLTKKDVKEDVTLCGWISSRRDHGNLIFIDLRDRYGITQMVFTSENKQIFSHAGHLSREDVIQISGIVKLRPKSMINKKIPTGEIEIHVKELKLINKSKTPPFEIDHEKDISEELRLKYRYLDLRREKMKSNIILRHKVVSSIREYMNSNEFIDI